MEQCNNFFLLLSIIYILNFLGNAASYMSVNRYFDLKLQTLENATRD